MLAAVHESVVGTFETCRRTLKMSVHRGGPEVGGAPSKWRVWPTCDIGGYQLNSLNAGFCLYR
jgi:hypothetical protein